MPCHPYTHPHTHALIHPETFPSPYQLHYHRPLAPAAALTERLEALNKLSNWAQPNGLPPISAGEVSELLQRWGLGWEVPPHVQGEGRQLPVSSNPAPLPLLVQVSIAQSPLFSAPSSPALGSLTGKCNFRHVRYTQRRLTASTCLWLPCVAGMHAAQYERQLQLHSSFRCGRGTSPSSAQMADSSRKRAAPPGGAWDLAAGDEEGYALQAVAAAKRGRWKAALQLALGHPQVGHTGRVGGRGRGTEGSSAAWPGVHVHALSGCCFASQ